ncbi:phospholipase A1-like [Anopheles ziemanni]|uniref:phospholipase A1-like n=1 Tax=Anopheles coustani TaxID=139045 RepID=UPI0026594644|nr:phospholipase A1-like [Anopheles coustani]XP_058177865.1 phospholipase A1-like [Anopheles ziemanni]
MNFALLFVLTAALVVNGLPSAQNPVPIASPDDLDDMEYEQDNDGDSHVPPIVVKRLNEAGEPIPLVQIPDKAGEFQVMSRMDVQEYRKNATNFEATKYVRFFLYRANMTGVRYEFSLDGVDTLVSVGFRLDLPTAILVHGWLGSSESEVIGPLAKALLEQDNKNVIAVDWEKGASTLLYPVARYRVPKVADVVAALIDNLVSGYGLDINRVGIIGHSLGAHIAGITAQRVRSGKIAYIVGLDPASPLFRVKKPDERLSPDDAKYVEIIHTNGKALGFYANIGQADFYPNGGVTQPGCGISFTCSHARAVDFFKESLKNRNYYAGRCDDLTNLGPNCSTSRTAIGGLVWRSSKPSGVYYMSTASIAPFLRSGALMTRDSSLWLMVFVPLVALIRW